MPARIPFVIGAICCIAAAAAGQPPRTLQSDDVVFMYAADRARYLDNGATVLAWGGAHDAKSVALLRELKIHPTGTMWCLTAGARALHDSAELRDAVAKDIELKPIAVPWLFDHTYQGTPSWWGCTNHPAFREHLRQKVRQAMAAGAEGLHVDDHLGVASPTAWHGGCFCEHCVAAFRAWLIAHSTPELLKAAGVGSFDSFDYRAFCLKHAATRPQYLKVQNKIPLHQEFVDCQLQLAAINVRELGQLASKVAGRPVSLSANTGLPNLLHTVVTPELTYMVAEVGHNAPSGTKNLLNAVAAYRMAEAIHRPLAATAGGHDWAYVNEHKSENLVRVWIALGCACGQRLMVPHHQWCFNNEKGTHWYETKSETYSPMYRFVRANPDLFRGFATAGPLAAPRDVPATFETAAKRRALQEALDRGKPRPMQAGDKVWVFPRIAADGALAVHLINLDYQPEGDRLIPQRDVKVILPRALSPRAFTQATIHRFDAAAVAAQPETSPGEITVTVPELTAWAIVLLK